MNAEEYKASLPKYGKDNKYTRWTAETFGKYINLINPEITMVPGQKWMGIDATYQWKCEIHGLFEKQGYALTRTKHKYKGNGCPECKNETTRKRNYKKTLSYENQLLDNGVYVLNHVGYIQSPSHVLRGKQGFATYRFRCPVCGNETDYGDTISHLKRPGTCCRDCATKRETIASHRKNKEKALSPCRLYVSSVDCDNYLKIGITNNYARRCGMGNRNNPYYDPNLTPEEHYKAGNIDLSYEHCWYLSPEFPRAWCFAVEQILLKATRDYEPKDPLPEIMISTMWAGQTELRDWRLEPRKVQAEFIKLIMEIQREDGDWYKVYQKHINTLHIK